MVRSTAMDPLSNTIAPNTFAEVNKEVKLAAIGQKRGSYLSFAPKEKVWVVQYSSVNGVWAAVRQFSTESIEKPIHGLLGSKDIGEY